PTGLLIRNDKGLNVVLIRMEDWLHDTDRRSETGSSESLKAFANEFVEAVQLFSKRTAIPLLVIFCPPSTSIWSTGLEGQLLGRTEEFITEELKQIADVYSVSHAETSNFYPVEHYYDARTDDLAHVPYTQTYFVALGSIIARKFHVLQRPRYKVIAVD